MNASQPLSKIKFSNFVFRYGDPDPELRHDYDMSIKLRMSAVQYVHTKRFQSELMAFVNHFSQIQESLRRMRTVAAGNEVRGVKEALLDEGWGNSLRELSSSSILF